MEEIVSRAKTLHEQLKQQQQQKLNFKQNNTGNSDSAPQPQQIHSLMYDWQQVLLRLMDKDLESNIGIKDLRLLRSLLHDWLTTTLPMAALTTANLAAVADMDFVLVYDTCAFLVSLLIIDSRQTSPIATSSSISSSSSPTVTFLATTVMTRYLPLIYSALIRLAYEEEEGGEGEQDAAASSGGGERNVADSSHSLRTYKTLAADLCERLFQGISSLDSMEAFITLMQQQQQPSTSSPSATTTSVSSTITKKIASRYLTRILLRSDGLHSLIEALVPATTVATANSGGNDHDQNEDDNSLISPLKLDALARIVLAVPWQVDSVEAYIRNICSQLVVLLTSNTSSSISKNHSSATTTTTTTLLRRKLPNRTRHCAAFLASQVLGKYPKLGRMYIVNAITRPFLLLLVRLQNQLQQQQQQQQQQQLSLSSSSRGLDLDGLPILADEADIDASISGILCLLVGNEPNPSLLKSMLKVVPAIYYTYQYALKTSRTSAAEPLASCISSILHIARHSSSSSTPVSSSSSSSTIYSSIAAVRMIIQMHASRGWCVVLQAGSMGGVRMVERGGGSDDIRLLDIDVFVNLMQQSFSDHPKLVSAVFIQVLELQALEAGNNNNGNNEQEEEVDESYRGTHFCNRKLMLGKLVLKLMETFGESLVADPWELIKFCSLILVNSINNSGSSDDDGISASSSSPSSSTIPCLNIVNNGGADINTHSTANGVNSVNSNDDGDDDDYDSRPSSMLIMTLGLLSIVFSKDVEDVPRNPNAETLTANLLVQLQTLVESSSSKSTISEKECADIKMLAIDLKMQLSAFISNMRLLYGSPSSSTEPSPQWLAAEMARLRQSLDEAVADTKDPLIPVRAFGLSQIRQLILTSASSIIKQQEQNSSSAVTAAASSVITPRLPAILALHLDHIHDNDSFIYLNAIKGLAALTDVYPRQTLLYISNRYATSSDGTTSAASSMGLDYRLRLGEVLLLTVQRCGPALRKYESEILPPILKVLHEPQPPLKSSALSLICEIAQTAPFALMPFIHQLVDYIHHIFLLEKTPETRRGAAAVILYMIRGLGRDFLVTLDLAARKSLLSDLRNGASVAIEKDELTRLHCQNALLDFKDIVLS